MGELGEHAVVLGASMGGLLAARMASDFYQRVTLVERDRLPERSENRKGVPQGRHAHALLARGGQILDELFPGLRTELTTTGVPMLTDLCELRFTPGGHLLCQRAGHHLDTPIYMASRPHLERHVRGRLRSLQNIRVLDQCEAVGLVCATDRRRVSGVRVVRCDERSAEEVLDADLVVDATGRSGRTTAWLPGMGYEPPTEEQVVVGIKYASRFVRVRPGALGRELLVISGLAPTDPRGVSLLACEDDRWLLTLGGYAGHHPPTDPSAMLEFARSLVPEHVVSAIRDAEYLTGVVTHRFPASVRRRYERLRRFPAGLVVFGDAICSFNPLYGQGMTVAALQALALRDTLAHGDRQLAQRFFRAVAKPIGVAWQMAAGGDLAMPEVEGRCPLPTRLFNAYLERLLSAAESDPLLTERFLRVSGLIDSPIRLLRPAVLRRMVTARRRSGPTSPAPYPSSLSSATTPSQTSTRNKANWAGPGGGGSRRRDGRSR